MAVRSILAGWAPTGSRFRIHATIAVGATVALLGLFTSPISRAPMNPARSLGPDIVSFDFDGWWVHITGPIVGAAIAVMLIGLVRGLPDKEDREAAEGGALLLKRWVVSRPARCCQPAIGSPVRQRAAGSRPSRFVGPGCGGVSGAYPGRVRKRWFSRRAFLLHAEFAVLGVGCLAAGWWQATRALAGNGLSWFYSVEWPAFAVIAVIGWWHLIHEDPEAYRARKERPPEWEATDSSSGN